MADTLTAHDARARRCPMLGHGVTFAYCRAPGRDLPCRKIFDCWWETFGIEAFIRAHFSEEQVRQVLAPPPDKMATLVELIERARRAADETSRPEASEGTP